MENRLKQVQHVDAHGHASNVWYEPAEVLLFQMDRCGIDRTLLVQIGGQYDNSYLFSYASTQPDRFGCIVAVDINREDACQELERLVEAGAAGLRISSLTRSPGQDPLAIWRKAERLKLPVSVSLSKGYRVPNHHDEFAELVSQVPQLTIVLEHLGGPPTPQGSEDLELRKFSFALSRFSNVYMKIGGLGEIARRPVPYGPRPGYSEPIVEYHKMAYEAFGAERLMWGSNFPQAEQQAGYAGALDSAKGIFAELTTDEKRLIFAATAEEVFFKKLT